MTYATTLDADTAPRISLRSLRAAAAALWAAERQTDRPLGTFDVELHSSLKDEASALPNFTPVAIYAAAQPHPGEIGRVEVFRFVLDDTLQEGEWRVTRERSD